VVCLQVPCLTYGMRGMIAASVEVKGPARDLHSGNDGGLPPDPCSLLCWTDATPPGQETRSLSNFYPQNGYGWTAGVFNEPLSDLMKVLASLVDAKNRILVKGFCDQVGVSARPSFCAQGPKLQAAQSSCNPLDTRYRQCCDARLFTTL
jgi:hypothetical protein